MSATKYYPEFDSTEVAETITPLADFDAQITAVLSRPSIVGDWLGAAEEYPFQLVVRAVAARVADTDPVAEFAALFADPADILRQLLGRTEVRIRDLYTRPLVAAINHARDHGRLDGSSPHERYRTFVERAARTSFEAVSGLSFPVLRDLTRIVVGNERDAFRELCLRLTADRPAIGAMFGIDAGDRLVSLGRSEGDSHHHGRSVAVLIFESGRRLVYKPRDVSCEAAYVTIASRLNARYGTGLVAATVLAREHYGYVEFVESEPVRDRSAEFMYASGELAAVLYLLNARDMHFENILPTRRGPLPIDLETILHPDRIHTGPTPEAPGNAYQTISQSIYGIGILPLVMAGKSADSGHVDLGFLGDNGRGTSPFKSMHYDQPYTDRIRLVFRAAAVAERLTVVDALTEDETHDLGRRMAGGFTRVFRAVLAEPHWWTALLREVAPGLRVRYVHNPTALYSQTLRMTAGPSALDDPDAYLALLKRIAIASKTSDRQIVLSEMRQLAERDVPYFTVGGDSVALTDGDGDEVGAAFARSPLDLALHKAASLSEFALGEQLRLVYSAFASRFPDNHLAGAVATPGGTGGPTARRGDDEAIAVVRELADRLVATSLPDRFGHLPRTWIGPLASAEASRPWPPGVLGYELYTGRTGPALALAAAGRVLDDERYRDLAGQIFGTTADILAAQRYEARSLAQAGYGGYTGMAGILFALSAAGRILDEPGWVGTAQQAVPLILDQIRAQPAGRVPLDVIGGLAGVLSCVTAIGGPLAADAAATLSGSLVAALHDDNAASRTVLSQSGFAHGVSGLLYALSRAYPLLVPERRAAVGATLGVLAERLHGFYDDDERNWSSNAATPGSFSTGWCHGAAGIALALAAYASVDGDDETALRRDLAVGNTIRDGFGRNLTWCHGDLGNHDVLTALAGASGSPLRDELTAIEDRWLRAGTFARKIDDTRSRYAHTNSLMVGSAGIVLHLVNRLEPTLCPVSPVRLTIGGSPS